MDLSIVSRTEVLPYRQQYQMAKRLMDVAICLIALPVVLPLAFICALAIRLDSPGPILFSQDRVGKGGRIFRMYKLRTIRYGLDDSGHRAFMKRFVRGPIGSNGSSLKHHQALTKPYVNRVIGTAEDETTVHKPVGSSEMTRVGRFLRRTSLDEMPQIINVLRGEMSLIGPRPFVPWEVEECQPWHYERLEVLPGITGLAQVRGRSSISFDSIARYDIEYVEKRSLKMDIEILLYTFYRVVSSRGAK